MKIIQLLFILKLTFLSFLTFCQDTLLYEGFENGIPQHWTTQVVKPNVYGNTIDWSFQAGGYNSFPIYAKEGNKNALFFYASYNNESTRLITPRLLLKNKVKPQLQFYHAMYIWPRENLYNDELRIKYKVAADSQWVLLEEYLLPVEQWVFRTIDLPDSILSDDFYLAFEGETGSGFGVCIDEVRVVETSVEPRTIESFTVQQASTSSLASGTKTNQLLRLDIKVIGNNGDLNISDFYISSLNSSDSDIDTFGVKVYVTYDSIFQSNQLLGQGNIIAKKASFNALNYNLKTGWNYLWVTADVIENAKAGNLIDFKVDANSFTINSQKFPTITLSPMGSRKILQTILFDDFETDRGWVFYGDFERNSPQGLGGTDGGDPDPLYSYGGLKSIGNDITGLGNNVGNYESNLDSNHNQAISPALDCFYFKNVSFNFQRWLNTDLFDACYIDLTTDSGKTWHLIWKNNSFITTEKWNLVNYNISKYADRQNSVKIRFNNGPNDGTKNYSGWNIDDVVFTGDYVYTDVGVLNVLSPTSGAGKTVNEPIKIVVKNFGAAATPDTIPFVFILDNSNGDKITVRDTLFKSLQIEEVYTFTFKKTINLLTPNIYNRSMVYSQLKIDQDRLNDTMHFDFYAMPTYAIPYTQTFENTKQSFWMVNGIQAKRNDYGLWQLGSFGKPTIKGPYSGDSAWITNLYSDYGLSTSSNLVSPYFNLSSAVQPMLQFYYNSNLEETNDGFVVEYSTNNGTNWTVFAKTDGFNWNWNPDDTVMSTQSKGWSSNSNGYKLAKQFIPAAAISSSTIFRFRFACDSSYLFADGVAIDNIHVIEAPHDLGVSAILSPKDACGFSNNEKLKVVLTNYGVRTLRAGEIVILGANANSQSVRRDTLVIQRNVPVADTIHLTMTKGLDLSKGGQYKLKCFTAVAFDENIYSSTPYNNDTAYVTVTASQPYVNFGPDVYSVRPDTVYLNAEAGPNNMYLWHDGSTNTYFDVLDEGTYSVTVTNSLSLCTAVDSIQITRLARNVQIIDLVYPQSSCFLPNSLSFKVALKNIGSDTLKKGFPINLYYKLSESSVVYDTLFLLDSIIPGVIDTISYSIPVNMSFIDSIYAVSIGYEIVDDKSAGNDSISNRLIEVYGPADFKLPINDTILTFSKYTIDASINNPTITEYIWSDSSVSSTKTIYYPGGQRFYITATDNYGCINTDSVLINLQRADLKVSALKNPKRSCGAPANQQVSIQIKNAGTYTYQSGKEYRLGYIIDSLNSKEDTLAFDYDFKPGDSLTYEFSSSTSFQPVNNYNIRAYLVMDHDSLPENDSIHRLISIYAIPVVSLGPDAIINWPTYTVNAGDFASYLWMDSTTNSSLLLNRDKGVVQIASVIITDSNGCKASDSKTLQFDFVDGINKGFGLLSDTICGFNKGELVKFRIRHRSTYYLTNYKATVSVYKDGVFSFSQQVILPNCPPYKDTNLYVKWNETIKEKGKTNYHVNIRLNNDIDGSNDTISNTFSFIGLPVINWDVPGDTIKSRVPYEKIFPSINKYNWSNGGTTAHFIATAQGWYSYAISDTNDCVLRDSIFILSTNSINLLDGGGKLEIKPNPVKNLLHLTPLNITSQAVKLYVVSENGIEIIKESIILKSDEPIFIDFSEQNTGVYFLIIENMAGQRFVNKIVKE